MFYLFYFYIIHVLKYRRNKKFGICVSVYISGGTNTENYFLLIWIKYLFYEI